MSKQNSLKATKTIGQVTTEQAQKIIDEKNIKDRNDCVKEIQEIEQKYILPVMEKYGCREIIQGQFVGNMIKVERLIVKK